MGAVSLYVEEGFRAKITIVHEGAEEAVVNITPYDTLTVSHEDERIAEVTNHYEFEKVEEQAPPAEDESEKFGFYAGARGEGYAVNLPHQCDAWSITPAYKGVSKEEAEQFLASFIAEATDALEALRAGRTFGEVNY